MSDRELEVLRESSTSLIDWDLIMTDSDTANELIQLKYNLIQSEIKLNEQAELIEKLQADVARYKPDYDRYSVLRNYKVVVRRLDELLPKGNDMSTRIKAHYEAASSILGKNPLTEYLTLRRLYLSLCHPRD